MSGHSKWSQIKRQKGSADAKRGQRFTKLANLITVAAKSGGGDPALNPRLRIAVEQARTENMPRDNIERAITRGTGEFGGAAVEELRFEVYGPGGVGILADAATDNPNRTTAAVKAVLNKHDGRLAAAGAVAYQFVQRGLLVVPFTGQSKTKEEIELIILESDAAAYEDQDDVFVVQTDPREISAVKGRLEGQGIHTSESKISWEPSQAVSLTDGVTARGVVRLLAALEDLDDVTQVTANCDIPDDLFEQATNG